MPTKLATNLQEIQAENTHRKYVKDWKNTLPVGSMWTPGSHGNPACKICLGRGWLRLDVLTWHPQFGKLQLCQCVDQHVRSKLDFENSRSYRPISKAVE